MTLSGAPVVGVVGGGQLARMMAQAAVGLGVRLRLLAEAADSSAAQVVHDVTVGDPGDLATLRAFAAGCDVLTFDHEHVPTAHLEALEADVKEMKSDLKTLIKDVARLDGKLSNLPTTFQLISWFVGVSLGLVALVFTVARAMK